MDGSFLFRYSTPLHDAVACGRQEIAKILIERGANVGIFILYLFWFLVFLEPMWIFSLFILLSFGLS